jgi:hypothetical protein
VSILQTSHPGRHDYQPGLGFGLAQCHMGGLNPGPQDALSATQHCNCYGSVTPGSSLFCRLAAIALLVLEDEESAFWCLVAIVETILPAEYYSKTLTASQVSRRVVHGPRPRQPPPPEEFLQASRSWDSASPTQQWPLNPLYLLEAPWH